MDYLSILDEILSSADVNSAFRKEYKNNSGFKNWIDKILPEIDACDKQPQKNPWHLYDVLTHILNTVSYVNELSKDLSTKDKRLLAYVMLFHDLGKPACHKQEIVDGKPRDRFRGHNLESEKIVQRTISNFGFNENEEKIIAEFVKKHDMFIKIRNEDEPEEWGEPLTEELVDREIADLEHLGNGLHLMELLVKVGLSDNLAQNLEMTTGKRKMLHNFDEILKQKASSMQPSNW